MSYWRTIGKHALNEARHALSIESTERAVISICLGVLSITLIWLIGGSPDAQDELFTKMAATAGIILLFPVVFAWKFIRAPGAMAREKDERISRLEQELASETRRLQVEHTAAINAQTEEMRLQRELETQARGDLRQPSLIDEQSRDLAGSVAAMKERALSLPFKFPLRDEDPFVALYETLKNSAHPIWTDQGINQLRREFMHSCHLIGAETEVPMTGPERRELREDMVKYADNLAAALLGEPYQVADDERSNFALALNVTGVLVQISELRSHRRLHITFTVFNGNTRDILLASIQGHALFKTEDGKGCKLYSPSFSNIRSNRIAAHSSAQITTEHDVPKKLAEQLVDWPEGPPFILEFTELDIRVQIAGEAYDARLPLWDAASVKRRGDQFPTAKVQYIR